MARSIIDEEAMTNLEKECSTKRKELHGTIKAANLWHEEVTTKAPEYD